MENAAEALKMAADFLVFIIALGISISSFSQAKETEQILLNYTDREYEQKYIQEAQKTTRIVGKETIIPTLYRAYKENYKVIFYDKNNQAIKLYEREDGNGSRTGVTVLDLQEQVLGTDLDKENFMMALLYGNKAVIKDSNNEPTMSFGDYKNKLEKNGSRIKFLSDSGICDTILEGKTYEEKFGVYYQDDLKNGSDNSTTNDNSKTPTPDANKQQKRVISYYLQG